MLKTTHPIYGEKRSKALVVLIKKEKKAVVKPLLTVLAYVRKLHFTEKGDGHRCATREIINTEKTEWYVICTLLRPVELYYSLEL